MTSTSLSQHWCDSDKVRHAWKVVEVTIIPEYFISALQENGVPPKYGLSVEGRQQAQQAG